MNNLSLILTATALLGVSGVPAILCRRGWLPGQRIAAGLMVAGSILGLAGTGRALAGPLPELWIAAWGLPIGQFAVAIDGLSLVFLLPIFVVPGVGAIYGLGYWSGVSQVESGRRLGFFYGLLAAAMALVVIARDGVLFLIVWEVMAVAAFFVATVEDEKGEVRRAGWIYLIATHLGTLCLIAMFALLHQATSSWALTPMASGAVAPKLTTGIFLLGLVGFGVKAGLMPVHVWLPGAHANAPSHVSAVMSGVMLKMGVYGIVRLTGILPAGPVWWGGLLLGVGALSGVLGIAFAIGQGDLKRLLAYSSIENIGIITMGVGLAVLGRSMERPEWIVLGLGGAVLHMWNHSLFKSLLFLTAGAVIHAVRSREIEKLGGLAKRMPVTAAFFVLGAVAICALPPLNGFVSEYVIYVGLLQTALSGAGAAWPASLGAVALALIGALAAACFVRLLGTVFLGEPRSSATAEAHEPGLSLLLPMAVLGGMCAALGLAPWLTIRLVERAASAWQGVPGRLAFPLEQTTQLTMVGVMGWVLLLMVALLLVVLKVALRGKAIGRTGTWDCGYARPTARMQYTGSSFGQSLVGLFGWALWPRRREPLVKGALPAPSSFSSEVPDTVLDRLVLPAFRFADYFLPWLRLLQQGRIHVYLLYILGAVLALLLWGLTGS